MYPFLACLSCFLCRLKETLVEAVSDAVCKEMGPVLDMHATRISQQELLYRTDKKASFKMERENRSLFLFIVGRSTETDSNPKL